MDNILDLLTRKILDTTHKKWVIGGWKISKLLLTPEAFELFYKDFKDKVSDYPFVESLKDAATELETFWENEKRFSFVYLTGLHFIVEKSDTEISTLICANFQEYEKQKGEDFQVYDIDLRKDFPLRIILNMKKL